jgi:hypothetical protein
MIRAILDLRFSIFDLLPAHAVGWFIKFLLSLLSGLQD